MFTSINMVFTKILAFADVKRLNRQDWIRYLKSPRCIFALILTFCILSITFTHVPGQSFFWPR